MRLRRQYAGLDDQETPAAGASRLRDLYALNGALLDLCLRNVPAAPLHGSVSPLLLDDYADCLTRLLIEIANTQPDPELAGAVAEAGVRLLPFRRAETQVFGATAEALLALGTLWEARNIGALRAFLRAHHDIRAAQAPAIVRARQMISGDG